MYRRETLERVKLNETAVYNIYVDFNLYNIYVDFNIRNHKTKRDYNKLENIS